MDSCCRRPCHLTLDYATSSIALLPFIVIPVVIGAGFATPRATVLLAALTVALGLTAGLVVYDASDVDFWFYLTADFAISGVAVWLAYRRQGIEVARQRAQRQAITVEEDFRLALENAAVGVALIALDGGIYSANRALVELTGRDAAWLECHEVADLLVDESPQMRASMRAELLADPHAARTREHRMLLADGREGWVKESIAVMRDGDGLPRGFVAQFEDVTEDRAARTSLERRAFRDPLTGLLNRGALLTELATVVGRNRRHGDGVALIYLDLDGLKPVNDRLGHGAGDQLIAEAAQRIVGAVRIEDRVARVGGDEFVVVLREVAVSSTVQAVAEKIRAAVARPLQIDGVPVVAAASLGFALDEPGLTVPQLLARADHALYRAKRQGGNMVMEFDPVHDVIDESLPELPRTS